MHLLKKLKDTGTYYSNTGDPIPIIFCQFLKFLEEKIRDILWWNRQYRQLIKEMEHFLKKLSDGYLGLIIACSESGLLDSSWYLVFQFY